MNRQELGQSLNLKIEMIPEGASNRSGRTITPQYITIHNTSNDRAGADANAHSRFVREKGCYVLPSGKQNFVSWHFTVDDKCVIKHLPVNERAIHAGAGNAVSIGIEICMHKGIDQAAANARAERLVAALMHDLNIAPANVRPHKAWTGKACPVLLLSTFDGFVRNSDRMCREVRAYVVPEGLLSTREFEAPQPPAEDFVLESLGVGPEEEISHDEEHELIAEAVNAFVH